MRIIGFLSKEARELLSLLKPAPLRPLLVLNLLAFICLRITRQLNLVIVCVKRKQTIPFALPSHTCMSILCVCLCACDNKRKRQSILIFDY